MTNTRPYSEWRKAISTLINWDATSVAFSRATPVSDTYGGATHTISTTAAQTVRLCWLPRAIPQTTETGKVVNASAMLLCPYSADVKVGDTCQIGGYHLEVVAVRKFAHKTEADLALR